MPFPYRTGVALDSAFSAALKEKLLAADRLRNSSRRAIDSLQHEIKLARIAADKQSVLGAYDAHRADSLQTRGQILQAQLRTAQDELRAAQEQFAVILKSLPRSIRKALLLKGESTPKQIVDALTEYVQVLQWRKWKWAGASALLGGFSTGLLLLLRR